LILSLQLFVGHSLWFVSIHILAPAYHLECLSEQEKLTVNGILNQLTPQSFPERLHRWVGKWSHIDRMRGKGTEEVGPLDEIRSLVGEVLSNPELLKGEVDWFMASDAEACESTIARLRLQLTPDSKDVFRLQLLSLKRISDQV